MKFQESITIVQNNAFLVYLSPRDAWVDKHGTNKLNFAYLVCQVNMRLFFF